MSRGWLQALKTPQLANRVTIAGLVDTSRDAAIRLRDEAELRDIRIETDLDVMLSAVRPDIVLDIVVPVYRDPLEMTGQVAALNYLKRSRGGEYLNLSANYEGGDPSLKRAS